MSEKIASLYAEIGGDTSALDTALGESTDSLNVFETQLGRAGDATEEFSETASDAADQMDDLAESADGMESSGGGVKEQFNALRQGLGAFNFVMGAAKVAFDEVTDSADRLGRTELGDSLDNVDASVNKLKDSLITMEIGGRDTIAWVTDAADGLTNLVNLVSISSIAFGQMTGALTDQEAAAKAAALVYQEVVPTAEQLAQAEIDAASSLDAHERAASALITTTEDLATAQQDANTVTDEARSVYGLAESAIRELNITEGERHALEVALKVASGELTAEDIKRENAVQSLTQQLDLGNISQQEYLDALNELATTGSITTVSLGNVKTGFEQTGSAAALAADQAADFGEAVDNLPTEHTTTITTNYVNNGQVTGVHDQGEGPGNGGMAEGGISSGPSSGYFQLLHGTEAVIPLKNGSVPVEVSGVGGGSDQVMWEMISVLRGLPQAIGRSVRDSILTTGK